MTPRQPGPELNAHAFRVATQWCDELKTVITAPGQSTDELNQAVSNVMSVHLEQLAATDVWGSDNRLASSHVWKVVGDVLRGGSLQLHAREKPLGYAGDFQLLERICQHDKQGSGIDRAFDEYFQQHAAPNAVRNRAAILADAIVEFVGQRQGNVRIVSYGSGPAFELRTAIQSLPAVDVDRLQVILLDLDPRALAFAERELRRLATDLDVCSSQTNLARVPKLKHCDTIVPSSDFIFASGFFDYLNQIDAARTIEFFWQRLNPNGQMFIFNFCQDNPSRAYMEWVANWYLTYRTDEEMTNLARQSNLPAGSWHTDVESAGVNRFLKAIKND